MRSQLLSSGVGPPSHVRGLLHAVRPLTYYPLLTPVRVGVLIFCRGSGPLRCLGAGVWVPD